MPLILGLLILLGAFFGGQRVSDLVANKNISKPTAIPTITPTSVPTVTPIPTPTINVVADKDPLITCNINEKCGGGTQTMKLSACKKSICCQVGSVYKMYASSEECTKAQGNSYPSCTIYYPSLGYSRTYSNTSPSDCEYWKQRAIQGSQPLNLPQINAGTLPTIEPYQYSQEYLNSVTNFNNTVNATWAPTQVILPTPRCYSSWEAYFAAHPNNSYNNIAQLGNPPCD